MATPIRQEYSISVEQLFKLLDEVIEVERLHKMGQSKELGLMSIEVGKDELLYLHLVQKREDLSEVSAATGLSFMKDRPQSDLPIKFINSLLQKLENKMRE